MASGRRLMPIRQKHRRKNNGSQLHVARALALDYDARMQVRRLVADTFERIVIYPRGIEPASDGDVAPIDLVIVARGGAARALRIDRKSGEWVAEETTRAECCPSAGGQPSDDSS